jgi:peroxiredoxin Q/BCP
MNNVTSMPTEGDEAPAFTGIDDRGEPISLADFRGHVVVLFFYPKDDTPG